jgi:hypothetical protein
MAENLQLAMHAQAAHAPVRPACLQRNFNPRSRRASPVGRAHARGAQRSVDSQTAPRRSQVACQVYEGMWHD